MHQHRARTTEETFDEGGGLDGRCAGRQAARQATFGAVWVEYAGIGEQPGRQSLHHPVHPITLGDLAQRTVVRRQLVGGAQQAQRGLGVTDEGRHRCRAIVVEPGTCGREPGAHTRHDAGGHLVQRLAVGTAHVAVSDGARQRRERFHQPGHIGGHRRPVADHRQQRRDRVVEAGQQRTLEQRGQLAQTARVGTLLRLLHHCGHCGRGDGGAEARHLDDPHLVLGFPPQLPRLTERAGAASPLGLATPRHAEQSEAVEQP